MLNLLPQRTGAQIATPACQSPTEHKRPMFESDALFRCVEDVRHVIANHANMAAEQCHPKIRKDGLFLSNPSTPAQAAAHR